jgi:hypothetical protein
MSRRDFAMLARLLAEHMEAADNEGDAAGVLALDTFGRDLVNHLDAANMNFDKARFTEAAGMSEGFRADV